MDINIDGYRSIIAVPINGGSLRGLGLTYGRLRVAMITHELRSFVPVSHQDMDPIKAL